MSIRSLRLRSAPTLLTASEPLRAGVTSSLVRARLPLLFVILGGALAILPAAFKGIPNNYDLPHHFHFALPLYEAVSNGTFFPSWLAESNFGFGNYVCRFYPPAFYYLLVATRALAGNWYVATLLSFAVVSILGSLGAYFWARCYEAPKFAAVAGIFYAFMPYHVSEIYQAALLAEFAAGAALLFAFGFVKRICDDGNRRDVAGLAVSYAALVLTHLPLAVLGSFALLVYGLLSLKKERLRSTLLQLGSAVLLTAAGTAFYWVKLIFEMKWILRENAHPNPLLDYRLNFLLSSFSPSENLSLWWMNILLVATFVMLLPTFVLLRRRSETWHATLPLFLLFAFTIFMATPLSRPLWSVLPPLQMTQHPFRWLAVSSTVAPVLLAASASYWLAKLRSAQRPLALIAFGAIAISLAFTGGQTIRDANYLNKAKFDEMLQPLLTAPSANHWLTVWAKSAAKGGAADDRCVPPDTPAGLVDAGERSVKIASWQREQRSFAVTPGREISAVVRTFYYPYWKASSGGQALVTAPDDNGALRIKVPAQAELVTLEFREPSRVNVAMVISAITWLLVIVGVAFSRAHQTRVT